MGSDKARRIFAGALAALLALLVWLCADGRLVKRLTAEAERPRQNESLYLERRGGGSVFVGGEGKLYGSDMFALVQGSGLDVAGVTDVVIGGGITEVGYDALCGYDGLQTVRLGDGVVSAGNGSIRECRALKYVFLPRGFSSAGRDFLFDCNNCVVVTDGPAEELPKMKNVGAKRVVADIDSYEALEAALGEVGPLPEALKRWWP